LLLHSHTESAFLHTESAQQRNLYRWNPNSWRPDASCRRAAHRGCRALSCIHTQNQLNLYCWHPISWWPDASCRLAAQQRNLYRWNPNSWRPDASCRRAAHRGCRTLSCIHTQNQLNLYRWHPISWRPDASCRGAAHRKCLARLTLFFTRWPKLFALRWLWDRDKFDLILLQVLKTAPPEYELNSFLGVGVIL
jgi:hypothetical protein